jgi:uncharacterized membrane protein YtjA (UPF0391 family)
MHKFRAVRRSVMRIIFNDRTHRYAAMQRGRHGTFRRSDIFMAEGLAALWRKAWPRRRTPRVRHGSICEVITMLNLVVTLLIIALIAAVLGFGGIATAAVGIAKIVFFVALLLFLIAALFGTMRGPRTL